jgi:predicted DCC family thiol-disulfide oxidoreductase YuxK
MSATPAGRRFPEWTVVYDGECKLCMATVQKLRHLPVRAELIFVPLQALISGQIKPWPGIDDVAPAALAAQMHVTDGDGRRYSGSEAMLKLLRLIPSLAWVGVIGGWPGFRSVSRLLYKLIARYRYRLFGQTSCSDGVCQLPRPILPQDGGELHETCES